MNQIETMAIKCSQTDVKGDDTLSIDFVKSKEIGFENLDGNLIDLDNQHKICLKEGDCVANKAQAMLYCVNNMDVILVCPKHDSLENKYFCANCIVIDKKHFNQCYPFLNLEECQRSGNIVETYKNNAIEQFISFVQSQKLKNNESAQKESVQLFDFANQLFSMTNELNALEQQNIGRMNESLKQNSQIHGADAIESKFFQTEVELRVDYLLSLTQSIIVENINSQLKFNFLQNAFANFIKIKSISQDHLAQELYQNIQKQISIQMSEHSFQKIMNNIPRFRIKVKQLTSFKKLLPEDIVFNTKMYLDLSKFDQNQRKQCLQNMYHLPLSELSINFASKLGQNNLIINNEIRHLSLNFSQYKYSSQSQQSLGSLIQITNKNSDIVNLQLLDIDLSLCQTSNTNVIMLVNTLDKVQGLKGLNINLKLNSIGITSMMKLLNLIKKYKQLKWLTLILDGFGCLKNSLGTDSLICLASTISSLKHLQILQLGLAETQINPIAMAYLITSIVDLKKLKILDLNLYGNEIPQDQIVSFFRKIRLCHNLKVLIININDIDFDTAASNTIKSLITQLDYLSQLVVDAKRSNPNFSVCYRGQQEKNSKQSRQN